MQAEQGWQTPSKVEEGMNISDEEELDEGDDESSDDEEDDI